MKTTEEIKNFAEHYFGIEKSNIPILTYAYFIDDYDEEKLEETYILDQELYTLLLEEMLSEHGIEDKTIIGEFKKLDFSSFDFNIPEDDINNLDDGQYCGWVIKTDNPDEIVYVKHAWM